MNINTFETNPEQPHFTLEDTYNYNISEYDVALHQAVKGRNVTKIPKWEMAKILWDMGMDTKKHHYTTIKQLHRCLSSNKPKKGLMYCGRERKDHEWQKSGLATLAGMIDNVWDKGLQQDLKQISRQ